MLRSDTAITDKQSGFELKRARPYDIRRDILKSKGWDFPELNLGPAKTHLREN